jgi:hypothetical protein
LYRDVQPPPDIVVLGHKMLAPIDAKSTFASLGCTPGNPDGVRLFYVSFMDALTCNYVDAEEKFEEISVNAMPCHLGTDDEVCEADELQQDVVAADLEPLLIHMFALYHRLTAKRKERNYSVLNFVRESLGVYDLKLQQDFFMTRSEDSPPKAEKRGACSVILPKLRHETAHDSQIMWAMVMGKTLDHFTRTMRSFDLSRRYPLMTSPEQQFARFVNDLYIRCHLLSC